MIACVLTPLVGLAPLVTTPAPPHPDLLTVAESSEYRCTATSAEVSDLVNRLAAHDPRLVRIEFGRSTEDRPLELLVVADPPVASAADLQSDHRLRVLVIGNIHAGEVCGKAASLMLARDLVRDGDPRLESIALLIAPNYNPDGNDRMNPDNRPGQIGPSCGMGERPNAQGLDLNRDWMKLESPEAQAMVRIFTDWDPHLIIDTHTTNGSQHRYALTYSHPLNPSGHTPSIAFIQDELLPAVSTSMLDATGYDSFFYGNFDRAHTTWSTYSSQPRFGGPYRGLRGQMSILSEAYAYIDFEDRVKVTYAFLDAILDAAHERREIITNLHDVARRDTIRAGATPQPDDLIGIRFTLAAAPKPVVLRGWEQVDGARQPRDYTVVHRDRFTPTLSVRRPHAYLLEPGLDSVVAKLRQHGVRVEPFAGGARVETYRVDAIDRAERPFQGHRSITLSVTARDRAIRSAEGWSIVTLDQPLGTLAAYLLEPRSDDGLATWNFFDAGLKPGADFPVHRVRSQSDLSP